MTARIVLENLKHKPMRSLLSILLVGVPVTLILCLVGLSHGMIEDTQRRTRAIGADVIVRPEASNMLSANGSMPEAVAGALVKLPHVRMAVGVLNVLVDGVFMGAAGIDMVQFERMSGPFRFLQGGPFEGPNDRRDVMVDEDFADERHIQMGDSITLLNRKWRVCGIFEGGKLAKVVLPLKVLQDLSVNTNKVTQIYLKLDDPANTQAVIDYMQRDPTWQDYKTYSMKQFMDLFTIENIKPLKEFVWVIVTIGVVIGFAVTCLSMYMAVLQRTREIGILKSLGGSNAFILRIILAEAFIMGVGGTALGIVMSFGAWWLIKTLLPASIPMTIVPIWWFYALGITLVGTLLGALYPGLTAARHDPIEALAYE